ncbi:hypothetical protein BKE81_05305 [Salmonella enterica]|nr:hypothetical protein [Salmonella enterica]ECM3645157.1 hypothetical protein [Salmonella enterica subsp. enterica serovar Typhimurium]EDP9263006.1 hypothetical protein [Salmonella enterica subsp. houtenae]EGZ4335457.1 hypothetical protein [Salmonella enterica subsp. enterica serovar Texas]MIG39515.1 hypothetical protein [Salmonella enterica subsp. enterica]
MKREMLSPRYTILDEDLFRVK